LQDGQGRRARVGRALSARFGAGGLGAVARRSRDPRAPAAASSPGQAAHRCAQPHLRVADAVRAARLVHPFARAGRARAARATGRLSKAGSRTLRWAAVEAANQAWRPSNPFHQHYRRLAATHGTNPAKIAVARKLLICAWHMLSRDQVFTPPNAAASSIRFQAAYGPAWN